MLLKNNPWWRRFHSTEDCFRMSNQSNEDIACANSERDQHLGMGRIHILNVCSSRKVDIFIGISNSGDQKIISELNPKSRFVKTQDPRPHSRAGDFQSLLVLRLELLECKPRHEADADQGAGCKAMIRNQREKDVQI